MLFRVNSTLGFCVVDIRNLRVPWYHNTQNINKYLQIMQQIIAEIEPAPHESKPSHRP